MGEKNKKKTEEQGDVSGKEALTTLPSFGLAEDVLGSGFSGEKVSREEGEIRERGRNATFKETDQMKFVTFFLDGEEYALPISKVQEIKRVGEITRVPNSPSHVRGVMNLRGRIVPVIELKKKLRLSETTIDKDSRIVVVEQGPKVLGLMVDQVAQVLNIASEQIDNAPEEVMQSQETFIKGIGKINGRMIIILELEKVVD